MKSCGFNTLRKHIKLEPALFYYYCDKYGMLVFQDMVNSGKYNFIIDTALPTVFLKKGVRRRASKKRKENFLKACSGVLEGLYNHPSVVYYTIFNEGWGQFDEKGCYNFLKSIDKTRICDTTSGWFKSRHTDVESDHVYFKKVKIKNRCDKPWVLSEFGGYSYKIKENSFNLTKTYGYKFFDNQENYENALVNLYEKEILPCAKAGLNGAVLTQLSDVEDETNGLLTYDRKVLKVSATRIKKVCDKVISAFNENLQN
jgi:beta-galactosidase/beta-glucuronidase